MRNCPKCGNASIKPLELLKIWPPFIYPKCPDCSARITFARSLKTASFALPPLVIAIANLYFKFEPEFMLPLMLSAFAISFFILLANGQLQETVE